MTADSAAHPARRLRDHAPHEPAPTERWESRTAGGRLTTASLASLPSDTWTVLHDLAWPGRDGTTVDQVVVGPGGVFVLASASWSGRATVADGEVREDGRLRESAVLVVAEAALALTPITARVTGHAVVPVLVLVGQERLSGWSRDVLVCSSANLALLLAGRRTVMSPWQVRDVALALDAQLRAPGAAPVRTLSAHDAAAASALAGVEPVSTKPPTEVGAWPALRRPPSVSASRARRRRLALAARATLAGALLAAVLVPAVRTPLAEAITGFVESVATPNDSEVVEPERDRPREPRRRGDGRVRAVSAP